MAKFKDNKNKGGEKWEYFDDCPICQAMKAADKEGRELTLPELENVFQKVKIHKQAKSKIKVDCQD